MGEGVPAAILAEAALANEEKNPQYSAKLYLQASQKVKSSQAANTFRVRAETLAGKTDDKITPLIKPTIETLDEVEEYCSVCRKEMTDLSSLVRCPECGSPAHYSHLAEWLKIRGVCPICKNKIKIIKPK